MQKKSLTPAQELEVCEKYQAGENANHLGAAYSVSCSTILRTLRRHNVDVRAGTFTSKYSVNHQAFDLLTEAGAYWLGFIAADGNISPHGVLTVSLAWKDADHLSRLKEFLSSDHPIARYEYSYHPAMASVRIASKPIAAALSEYGVVPNKTFTLQWPDNLPYHLESHFIRGYFDGDGHVSVSPQMNITGSTALITSIQDKLIEACGLFRTKFSFRRTHLRTATMHYKGRRVMIKLRNYLYSNASVWMPRKYERFFAFGT